MKRLLSILILAIVFCEAFADTQTEKEMSAIKHSNKYLYGTAREETEQEAYEEALKMLIDNVSKYLQSTSSNLPETIYLPGVKSMSERLVTYTSSRRVNMLLYVEKSKLLALGHNDGVLISRNNGDTHYSAVDINPEPEIKSDTVVIERRDTITVEKIIERPMSPTLSRICSLTSKSEIQPLLVSLKKDNEIKGAAAFPLSNINDFYLVVVDGSGAVVAVLHSVNGKYYDIKKGTVINVDDFAGCSAYWIVLK